MVLLPAQIQQICTRVQVRTRVLQALQFRLSVTYTLVSKRLCILSPLCIIITRCLKDVNAWLSASRLRLNPAKTQILWLGSKYLVSDIAVTQVPVLASSVTVADSARDLGVVIDSCLTMADHVSAICRSGYFQLRQLRPVARSLTADAANTIVHAFVACRLDYCNSLLHGITDSLFRRLQSIQNACCLPDRGYSATGSHHSGSEGPPLSTGSVPCRLQASLASL